MWFKCKNKSQVYVKDYRKVLKYNGKILKYPKNYHKIVQNGRIIVSDGDLKLVFGEKDKKGMQPSWALIECHSDECHSKAYYTINAFTYSIEELPKSSLELFKLSTIDLQKYLPVIDVKKTDDPNNPYQIVNTLYLAKRNCPISNELDEVNSNNRKEKGLNGKQLYISTYSYMDPVFFIIRDDNDKVEYDKTVICFPVLFFAFLIIFIRKCLTFLPMIFGEYLLSKQNSCSKITGIMFFSPFVPVKFIVDLAAIMIKSPVLLFVLNEKKYGDSYFVLWKHELMEIFYGFKSDFLLMKNGKRPITMSDCEEYTLIGTSNELNVRKSMTEVALSEDRKQLKEAEDIDLP